MNGWCSKILQRDQISARFASMRKAKEQERQINAKRYLIPSDGWASLEEGSVLGNRDQCSLTYTQTLTKSSHVPTFFSFALDLPVASNTHVQNKTCHTQPVGGWALTWWLCACFCPDCQEKTVKLRGTSSHTCGVTGTADRCSPLNGRRRS